MEPEILPEHESIEAFTDFLLAEERASFSFDEAEVIARGLGVGPAQVIDELKSFGFAYLGRPIPRPVRGYRSNNHDRWYGPGSSKTHGGSGHEQIQGFAGQKG